jgi:hypothetical protein
MKEEFKDIPGYEGFYQISNLGRLKSLKRVVKHKQTKTFTVSERIRTLYVNGRGYYSIYLYKDGGKRAWDIHKLVAITFLNHIPSGMKIVVDHINNIKTDNRVENLQLTTQRKNASKDKKGGSSKYLGVSISRSCKKWRARIYIDGKENHLGSFDTEYEAHLEYQKALNKIN